MISNFTTRQKRIITILVSSNTRHGITGDCLVQSENQSSGTIEDGSSNITLESPAQQTHPYPKKGSSGGE